MCFGRPRTLWRFTQLPFRSSWATGISYPSSGKWWDIVKAGRGVFAGGGGAWLAFHRSPFRYIVYSAVGHGCHEKAGLAVDKNGHLLVNLRCRGAPISELEPDFFSIARIPDDDTPFDLP